MSLFDNYIFVDWSAKQGLTPVAPTADAVWVGELNSSGQPHAEYFRSRRAAYDSVRGRLVDAVSIGRRVLIGFDFPCGYPAGFGDAVAPGVDLPTWRRTWSVLSDALTDDTSNLSNRFDAASELNRRIGATEPGPFWGVPVGQQSPSLNARRLHSFPYQVGSDISLAEFRLCERRLRGTQSVWKLYGAGSVGSQALTGIPYVSSLRFDGRLAPHSRVWPFETGFSAPDPVPSPFILHAEIWPGVIAERVNGRDGIRDKLQVLAMCEWARDLDEPGLLSSQFATPLDLGSQELDRCVNDEGWILGCA